ncbi:MAG: hypothetical protein ACXVJD_00015 [Mucilaginibacter sp.]
MKKFNEHDTVVYTDADGRQIDTFVIHSTDPITGLTHINHENLRVPLVALAVHPKTVPGFHLPMSDAFSFEIFKKLKEKYENAEGHAIQRKLKVQSVYKGLLKAS